MSVLKQPLSNTQLEILKAFAHNLSDEDLLALKKTLALFFAEKLIKQADQHWEQNQINETEEDKLLNTKLRKKKS